MRKAAAFFPLRNPLSMLYYKEHKHSMHLYIETVGADSCYNFALKQYILKSGITMDGILDTILGESM